VTYEDTTLTAGTTSSTVRTGERNYTVQLTIADETNPGGSAKQLKRITITVTPQTAGADWMRTPVVLVSERSTLAPGPYLVAN
jgi:hypothetical protein